MNKHRIAVIPGDGIGVDVINEGIKVIDTAKELTGGFDVEYTHLPWSCEYYLKTGRMMPEDGLDILKDHEAIYLGAVGFPGVPDHISLWGLLLPIRKEFDEYINLRPIKLLKGIQSPLRKGPEDIDFVVVRENVEGEYSGAGGIVHQGTPSETAIQTSIFTRVGTERVIRYAFELARKRGGKKSLISATKSNALNYSMVFWDRVFNEVAKDYPDVTARLMHVDALAGYFILKPEQIDVVVASNLFGDILTDLGSAMQGSIGIAPSANINPEKKYPSMFEPVHGSAPDIAGKGIANPIGAIWTASMMLDFLGESDAARLVFKAMEAVTEEGTYLTADLGGKATTQQVGEAVRNKMRQLV
ncbi:tartrate dehydrogenase/decarboxylase / D-malate dehydrogenase [Caldanaerobius fijiensis DSM 17918]|uniref:D-malate dehydrogenase (decarboxylating) n=1 Tax=Caldanaerobius fijiensis DSM 17918 TaxID=1121256 RepID=A0A1M4T7Y9_9THEO|nr:tartrate dehydrogenase [Caldanaerobius fijiensis]SHE40377.1 tartrate dehydrogenase/decarboxylase / D-malate dehydrogenase [Caldanaerobius fijiensis DSM 17918]